MKQRIILIAFTLLLVFGLASCKKDVEHNVTLEEVETRVKWEQIEFEFKINGETDEIKIADNSLEVSIFKNGNRVATRQPSKNASSNYWVQFTSLQVNTNYELVVTASISQKKVELIKKDVKTLLEGGSESDPILISSVQDFKNISNVDAYYKLATSIDFNGEQIPEPFKNGLRGQFDGDGHALMNFTLPYENYNGIFGYMSQGTGVVKNLTIKDVTYDNYVNIENRKSVSLYVGLIAKELGANTKVQNVTFSNINVRLYTETYGIRYFGLVTGSNKGTIEDITLDNVNFNVDFNNVYESQIGGVVGKNYSTGKIQRVNYASGNFNVLVTEHVSNPQNIYQTYIGTIVGEGSGKVGEVVSSADVIVKLRDYDSTKKVVEVEGERFVINAQSIPGGVSSSKFVLVDKTDEVSINFNYSSSEAIDKVLLNGIDKTADVVDKTLVIDPTLEKIYVQVSYKTLNIEQQLTLSGSYFKVLSATLEGVEVYNGEGELPENWAYGTVLRVKGLPTFGKLVSMKLNGVNLPITDDVVEFPLLRNSHLSVKYAQVKPIYIGGIGGAVGTIENALYQGSINFEIPSEFNYFEEYFVGGIAGTVYGSASNIAAMTPEFNITNDSQFRKVTPNRLIGILRGAAKAEGVVAKYTIKINGVLFDDGHETLTTRVPDYAFTSLFVRGLIDTSL